VHHCDDDSLAAAALGEDLTPSDAEHIAQCEECNSRVAEFFEVTQLASVGGTDLVTPPPQVWNDLDSRLFGDASTSRRSPRAWLALVAAAASVVTLASVLVSSFDGPNNEQVVAAAQLAALPGGPGGAQAGEALVHQTPDGMALTISASGLTAPSGYYEAWLLDPVNGGAIALGVIPANAHSVTLPMPEGADLAVYTAVDVSDEPFDGNPGHSTVSVLRGVFDA
jgi:hypothetical protein